VRLDSTAEMQNKWEMRRNEFGHVCKHPMNVDLEAFGTDTYDQDSTQGSKLEDTKMVLNTMEGSKEPCLD
jgi:hypothetical protein